ncbi:MAG: hemolysin family protein [Bifidobacteriaceae bacterium]|jgi:CBS domain containing-hemolysin-like protein|nr:hemolysin family protein [Bifidobacteriaceae bacterium]
MIFFNRKNKFFNRKNKEKGQIDQALTQIGESTNLEEDERQMIKSVVELGDTMVREVMVPRTSMEVLEKADTLKKALAEFLKTGFSRMPVIEKNADDILGIAYFKDLVRCLYKKSKKKVENVGDIVRKAVFVPESMTVDSLLKQMQSSHSHIAIVVDEYGGVAGLVTLEDVLEEIVGEVVDEFDKNEEIEPEKIAADSYRVSTRMSIDDLAELFNVKLDYEDIDTVGGLFNKALGTMPKHNSEAQINGLKFVADKISGAKKQVSYVIVKYV